MMLLPMSTLGSLLYGAMMTPSKITVWSIAPAIFNLQSPKSDYSSPDIKALIRYPIILTQTTQTQLNTNI